MTSTDTQPVLRQWKVWFRSKNADQVRFHKAFTLPLAATAELAKARVIEVRPGEVVEILSCDEVPR
jgi:hypothetical protein